MRLYLVTDRGMLGGKDLIWTVEQAVQGGVTMVQLREKDCTTREFVELARVLKQTLRPYNVPLLINDRVDVVLAADADGVHVGQSDMSVADLRRLLPKGKIVGLSVESPEQFMEANALDVDYIALSPIFSTPTKEDTITEWGLDGIKRAKAAARHPLAAIGGIHVSNVQQIVGAGADYVCVVSEICASANPKQAAENILKIGIGK